MSQQDSTSSTPSTAEATPGAWGTSPQRLDSERAQAANHTPGFILHDFDSLPTVDSGKAGGDGIVPLSRQFKDRVVQRKQERKGKRKDIERKEYIEEMEVENRRSGFSDFISHARPTP